MAALQERKQALEALLSSRVGELKQVCLQEAVRPPPRPNATSALKCSRTCWCLQRSPPAGRAQRRPLAPPTLVS